MITEVRPSIHHFGDQLIWVQSKLNQGKTQFEIELSGDFYNLFKGITHNNLHTRYQKGFSLNYDIKFRPFDNIKNFSSVELPKTPFITYQFDSSKEDWDASHIEYRAHVFPQETKNKILNYYENKGYSLIDVGNLNFNLNEMVYLMTHSEGHVGISSACAWIAACCSPKFNHMHFNCTLDELSSEMPRYLWTYGVLASKNNIKQIFRDPNFDLNQDLDILQ